MICSSRKGFLYFPFSRQCHNRGGGEDVFRISSSALGKREVHIFKELQKHGS